ncbi:TPA: hypothetical protein ACH3X3_011801 [Trebouxia sp. C0006]
MAQQLHRDGLYNPDYPLDVYALGLLPLEMTGGRRPAGHEEAVLQALTALPSLRSMPAACVFVPAGHASASVNHVSLASIIKGCLETDPVLRSSSWQVNEQLSLLKTENKW